MYSLDDESGDREETSLRLLAAFAICFSEHKCTVVVDFCHIFHHHETSILLICFINYGHPSPHHLE